MNTEVMIATEESAHGADLNAPAQILHVVAQLDGYGLTRQLELLAAAQVAAGQQVRLVAMAATRQAIDSFRRLGVDCRVLDRRWQRDVFTTVRLAGELRGQRFDLLHLWGEESLDYFVASRRLAAIRGRLPKKPIVTSLPDRTLLNCRPGQAIAPGIVLPIGPRKSRQQFLAEQSLPDEAILIAVAGRLTRSQQIDEAIWHFELVRTLDQRVCLLIFGDGPDLHRLERFSRLTSEPSAIRFLGFRNDFRELLPHVDLLWHTRVPSKTLSLTVLEAMGSGIPVVANDSPGNRQIIRHGDNGFLVPDKDRAAFARLSRRLLQDDESAHQIGVSAARSVHEQLSVERMTSAYEGLYSETLQSGCSNLGT